MKVVYSHPGGRGWDPATLLAHLAAELLDADLLEVSPGRPAGIVRRSTTLLPRRRGQEQCLVIAGPPSQLQAILHARNWLRGYGFISGWVIDSFWAESAPRVARDGRHFDHIFVTEAEVVDVWQDLTETSTTWLPFGSDVLRRGSMNQDRPVDLQRLGRQPPQWDDDASVAERAAAVGLTFGGRPPFRDTADANQRGIMERAARAKFTLSFTNTVSPESYTHPSRQYLSARWLDALASGASVAGIAPECASARRLLWPGATLDFGGASLDAGMARLGRAVEEWRPVDAVHNYAQSLQRTDWRWRLRELADVIGHSSSVLDDECARLSAAIDAALEVHRALTGATPPPD